MHALPLQDYRRIWRVTTVLRESGKSFLFSTAILMLLVAMVGVFAFAFVREWTDPLVVPRMLVGAATLWLALVWFVLYMPASLVLHAGANARLLPRQRRRLVEMAAAGFLLVPTGLAIACANWRLAPLAGLAMLAVVLIFSGNRAAWIVIFGAGNWSWLSRLFLPSPVVDAVESDAGQLVLALAVLAWAAWTLPRLYPAGRHAYLERQAAQVGGAAALARRAGKGHARGKGGDGGRWLYRIALRCAIRRRAPGALLAHALGPAVHWSAWFGGAVSMVALGGTGRLALTWTNVPFLRDFWAGVPGLGLASLPLAIAFGTAAYGQGLRKRRGEQALLRLTPLAGDVRLLNRRLAAQFLRGALTLWGMMTAAIMLTAVVVGAQGDVLVREFALCCLAGQVATEGLLGEHAENARWRGARTVLLPVAGALSASLAIALGERTGSSPWLWLIALVASVVLVHLWLGWRRMLARPVIFPTGHA